MTSPDLTSATVPPDPTQAQALATAVAAARAAGAIHLRHLGQLTGVGTKSSPADLVTVADAEAEQAIRQVIAAAFPTHAILGEEEGETGAGDWRWVIDPLDGTVNFAHGYPVFCASVALEYQGEAVVGAVYDPNRDELFTASRGGGAFLNGQRLQTSAVPSLSAPPLVATGFPYDTSGERNLVYVAKLLRLGIPVRRPGAAALDLCNVACGRMDAYWEIGVQRWDVAAGALIVREAGGQVSDLAGQPTPYGETIVATNGPLHAELLALLNTD